MTAERGFARALGEWLVAHRVATLLVALCAAMALAVPLRHLQVGYSVRSFTRSELPELRQAAAHYAEFAEPDHVLLVGLFDPAPLADATLARLRDLDARWRGVDGVERVLSLASVPPFARLQGDRLRDAARGSHTWRGLLLGKGDALGALLLLDPQRDAPAFRAALCAEVTAAARAHGFARCVLSGMPFHRATLVEMIRADQALFLPLGAGVSLVLLLWLIPGVAYAALAMAVVPLTLLATFGAMAALGVPITMLTSTLPCLLMAMAVADGVHLVGRFQEERRAGADPREAATRTVAALLLPCFLTSLTTVIGFATLAFTVVPDLRDMGRFAALGMAAAYVFTIAVVPPALSFVQRVPPPRRVPAAELLARACARLAEASPRMILLGSGLVLLGATVLALRIDRDERLADDLWPDSHLARSHAEYAAEFGAILPGELLVRSERGFGTAPDLERLAAVVDWLAAQPMVDRSLSIVDVWRDGTAPALLQLAARTGVLPGGLLSGDGKTARVLLFQRDLGTKARHAFSAAVATAAAQFAPLEVRLAGVGVVAGRLVDELMADLLWSFAGSLLLIFAVLGVALRSLRYGLLAVLPNLLPFALTLAVMVCCDIKLRPLSVITFCIAFGLAVDNTTHLLARYKQARALGAGAAAALAESTVRAGEPVIVTNLLLICGFATIFTSEFKGTFEFGLLVVVALAFAMVAALLVLPALVRVLGPRASVR